MSQLGLFEELPQAPAKSFRATVVRSHYRRVPGDPDIPSESKPDTAMQRSAKEVGENGRRRHKGEHLDSSTIQYAPLPHNGTKTSRAAAEGVSPERSLSQKDRIFRAVLAAMEGESYPLGATREQVAMATGIDESTVCARVRPIITGADTRYQLVEPGITRIGAEGARQKVLWVGIEQHTLVPCSCERCGGAAQSRIFEVAHPSAFDPAKPAYQCYISVQSCTLPGCWWWRIA